jgi:hypothetical protein
MLIISRGAIAEVAAAISSALVGATDHRGRAKIIGTIDPAVLENIALGALMMASGETILRHGDVIEKSADEMLPWLRTVYPR